MEKQVIKFKDLNFKLAVIQELMYTQKILLPVFDIYDFAEEYKKRKIDIEKEGYDIIPEALKYFKDYQIPEEFAEKVEYISQDGGDEIYMQICPFWDGEDDIFNIKSADDASNFPNLKEIVLFFSDDSKILDDFIKKGIDAEWL